jgi:NADPH:quinone reductase-like Zn-dependent oxidoreductase
MKIPKRMNTAAVDRFGPPAAIRMHRMAVPQPGPDEILIRVETAGIGSWDASIRDGTWRRPGRPAFPLVLGTDGAGIVVAKGARARGVRIGDHVYAYEFGNPKGGFYAEYATVKANHAARVPPGLPPLQAGAAAPTALTALQGVVGVLRLRKGETVLVFGASGAVGSLAVQFAKHRGARVLATASGRSAAALVRSLGADAVIDARRDDAADRLWKLAPRGIDAALAFAGGDSLERCLDLMRPGGRVAFPNGVEPGPPRRRCALRLASYDLVVSPRCFARLARCIAATPIRIPIAEVFSLADAARAHRRLAKGGIHGRMVFRIAAKAR